MTVINRKDVRSALATYLQASVTKAQAVYPYQVADFNGASPVVYITSSGSARVKLSGLGFNSNFVLNIHTFVLYPKKPDLAYSEQTAENLLDDLEQEIASACLNIKNHSLIKAIMYDQPSNADGMAEIAGETYLHEIISVNVNCF